jgi:lysophospholipase L1-like esterase
MIDRPVRGVLIVISLVAVLVTGLPVVPVMPVSAGFLPARMSALGDSITRGFNACGWYVDCASRSFATGSDTSVNSQYLRIRAVNPAINGHAFNDARSGAKAVDMAGQAQTAVSQGVEYVTLLIGANDACTSSESSMTAVATFRAQIDAALTTLRNGLPAARVFVASVPDIKRLWQVGSTSASARATWGLFGICQSMLANPTSTAAADVARRDRVRARVVDFNTQLAAACTAYGANCLFDNNAIFGYPFALSQISTWDYFHPNPAGQAVLAQVSYAAGFNW